MYFTGFADEAATDLAGQIRATKELGWSNIECRNIDGVNIHDLPQRKFNQCVKMLEKEGVQINCFGSAIANWAHKVTDDFDITLQEVKRAIPRMKRLGTKFIRIMSYAWHKDQDPMDQMREERFRRLNVIVPMFLEEGIQPLHENCMNYGGLGWPFTLELLYNVPGLKLIFDTGNPVFSEDRSKPKPYPRQSCWEFWEHVRHAVAYIHIKDGIWLHKEQKKQYTWCGEGDGDIQHILNDAFRHGFDGPISIEPHLCHVFHEKASPAAKAEFSHRMYIEYGKRIEKMVAIAKCPTPVK